MDYIADFIAAMQRAGFEIDRVPVADDRIHTVRANGERNASFSYQLMIDDGGAVGWFKCFKEGHLHKYHSRANNAGLTPEQADALRKRRQEAAKRRDKQIAEAQAAQAAEARRIWASCAPADGSDAYSKRKGIVPQGARWFAGGAVAGFERPLPAALVVPVYDNKGICNLQFITPEVKLFMPQARLQGCYGVVSKGAVSDTLWIAEGFASAVTVSDALGQTVAVAFNAGNLKAVADKLAAKYASARICIAADNDHETEAAGKGNAGITKAKESGYEFSAPPPEAGVSDWNDYAAAHGLAAVKETLLSGLGHSGKVQSLASPSASASTAVPDSNEWEQQLTYNDKGGLVKSNLNNIALFFRHHEEFRKLFWYDAFFRQVMVRFKGNVEPISDEFVMDVCLMAERRGLGCNFDVINKLLIMVAKERPINPAKLYFDALKWDGYERLHNWLQYYFGADEEPDEYLAFIGKKWLTAAVKRVFEAGCKFDHVLVMEGEQGLGKSTALRTLATFGDEKRVYCTDAFSFSDIDDKDSIRKTNGNIIVELAEMVGHNKKETEEIKRWIGMQEDVARFAYARHEQRFPRMFVLACTTNSTEYLNDPSGNRRYWPFRVKAIDLQALAKDRQQLWAEAVHWYKMGLYIGPTPEEMELAKAQQVRRLESDPWDAAVTNALVELSHKQSFTTGEVMASMGMALRDKDFAAKRRIGSILMGMGYENKARWDAERGKTVRDWRLKDA